MITPILAAVVSVLSLSSSSQVQPVFDPTPIDAYVVMSSGSAISACTQAWTGGPGLSAGASLYWAGTSYPGAVFMRDFGAAVRGNPTGFPASDILATINTEFADETVCSAALGIPGSFPATLYPNGTCQEAFSYDAVYDVIDLVWSYYKITGSLAPFTSGKAQLDAGLNAEVIDNHLCYTSGSLSGSGWGYEDGIATSGHMAMMSVLRFRALKQMGKMAVLTGTTDTYSSELPNITTALGAVLFDGTAGLLKHDDGIDQAHDIAASAYGVWVGAFSPAVSGSICARIATLYSGSNGFFHGVPAMVMGTENFINTYTGSYSGHQFQAGGYWPAFEGWAAYCVSLVNYPLYQQMVQDFLGWNASVNAAANPTNNGTPAMPEFLFYPTGNAYGSYNNIADSLVLQLWQEAPFDH